MKTSDCVRMLMQESGDNPNSLARKLGVSQPTIHRLATGKAQHTFIGTVAAVANYYRVELEALLDGRIVKVGAPCATSAADDLLAQLPAEDAALWLAKIQLAVAEHKVALKLGGAAPPI